MSAITQVSNIITNAPLASMIEKMGVAIANAQLALDGNAIEMLKSLAKQPVEINGNNTNLLALGFMPSFYAFTEVSFETKLEFSLAESESFSVGGTINFTTSKDKDAEAKKDATNGGDTNKEKTKSVGMIAASFNASYARKFDQAASGASSISARMISLPPPDSLLALLKQTT
jgi:hypothetical protein